MQTSYSTANVRYCFVCRESITANILTYSGLVKSFLPALSYALRYDINDIVEFTVTPKIVSSSGSINATLPEIFWFVDDVPIDPADARVQFYPSPPAQRPYWTLSFTTADNFHVVKARIIDASAYDNDYSNYFVHPNYPDGTALLTQDIEWTLRERESK